MYQHFVRFFFEDGFVKHVDMEVVNGVFDPKTIPVNAFAFRFFDRCQSFDNGQLVSSGNINYSPLTFVGAAYSFEEIVEQFPEKVDLIALMKCNGWKRMVRTVNNNWYHIEDSEKVI